MKGKERVAFILHILKNKACDAFLKDESKKKKYLYRAIFLYFFNRKNA